MVSSADRIKNTSKARVRDRLYRVIADNENSHKFRAKFYSRFLSQAFQKGVTDKEALTHTFNDVTITLLRPSAIFDFNGLIEMAILEHEGNTVILTGEIMKKSLANPTKFFNLSDDDPETAIDTIFSKLVESYDELERDYPDEYERRDHIVGLMTNIDYVDTLYEQKVRPLELHA